MPEGDTIFRAAETLRRWLVGREVTGARGAGLLRVVGSTVTGVEPRAKHLMIRFSSGHVLHTHMRMTGSWHVYPAGAPWQKPARQAKAVIECGERVAVCFNAPVVELLDNRDEQVHPALRRLGPDVLADDFDPVEVLRRARLKPAATTIGELLLDQTVVSGLGNVYRCEALFEMGIDPWKPVSAFDDASVDAAVATGRRLISANTAAGSVVGRSFGDGTEPPFVHGRNGRPCRRCGTLVRADRLGHQARIVYWCPGCQR